MLGFGHRIHKDENARAAIIYNKAKESKLPLTAFEKAYAIEAVLEKPKGKKLPLNMDGAFAVGILAFGMNPRAGKALLILARIAGMGAYVIEDLEQWNGYRRLV